MPWFSRNLPIPDRMSCIRRDPPTDGARVAREPAEGDQSPAVLVADLLVVDEPDVLAQNGVQHGHVLFLGLDHVAEEHVGLALEQFRVGHLLHADDQVAVRNVLVDLAAHCAPFRVLEDPQIRALHHDFDGVSEALQQSPALLRRDGAPPLPLIELFLPNPNFILLCFFHSEYVFII